MQKGQILSSKTSEFFSDVALLDGLEVAHLWFPTFVRLFIIFQFCLQLQLGSEPVEE